MPTLFSNSKSNSQITITQMLLYWMLKNTAKLKYSFVLLRKGDYLCPSKSADKKTNFGTKYFFHVHV